MLAASYVSTAERQPSRWKIALTHRWLCDTLCSHAGARSTAESRASFRKKLWWLIRPVVTAVCLLWAGARWTHAAAWASLWAIRARSDRDRCPNRILCNRAAHHHARSYRAATVAIDIVLVTWLIAITNIHSPYSTLHCDHLTGQASWARGPLVGVLCCNTGCALAVHAGVSPQPPAADLLFETIPVVGLFDIAFLSSAYYLRVGGVNRDGRGDRCYTIAGDLARVARAGSSTIRSG